MRPQAGQEAGSHGNAPRQQGNEGDHAATGVGFPSLREGPSNRDQHLLGLSLRTTFTALYCVTSQDTDTEPMPVKCL
jgi:hypothetical protein